MDHKVICYEDYGIPVPIEANWLAQDANGRWYWYIDEPTLLISVWSTNGDVGEIYPHLNILPPEPGPWTEQLYWIGD